MEKESNGVNGRKVRQFILFTGLSILAILMLQWLPCPGCLGTHSDFPTETDVTLWEYDFEVSNPCPEKMFVDKANEKLGTLKRADSTITLHDSHGTHVIWGYAEYDHVRKISNHRNRAVRIFVSRVLAVRSGLWVFEIDLKTHEVRDYVSDCEYKD